MPAGAGEFATSISLTAGLIESSHRPKAAMAPPLRDGSSGPIHAKRGSSGVRG